MNIAGLMSVRIPLFSVNGLCFKRAGNGSDKRNLLSNRRLINGWSLKGWGIVMLLILFCTGESVNAQRRVDVGGFLGASYYLGDLNPGGHFKNSHPAVGALIRYNFSYRWSLKGALTLGSISGAYPSKNVVLSPLTPDSYQFKRTMLDLSGMVEFNFLPFDHPFIENSNFTPYLTVGLATTEYRRYEVDSQQGNNKSVFLLSLPFGLGVKYKLTDWVRIGAEWTLRKTFVDDLDLITSQPPVNPADPYAFHETAQYHNNDWYSFAGVIVSFSMFDRKISCQAGYKKY